MAPISFGFWGEPTATIDWCENNYEVSFYVAEFWNTVTNLMMIVPGLCGAYFAWVDRLELRFITCYLGLIVVGIGSWCFHMTLLYKMQLLDELPMLLTASVIAFCLLDMLRPVTIRRTTLIFCLSAYSAFIIFIYLAITTPVFFQVAFAVLYAVVTVASYYVSKEQKHNKMLFLLSCGLFVFSFIVWNIDNIFCSGLTSLRERMPVILRPLTQFHGLWHLGTGFSSYVIILFCIRARLDQAKDLYYTKLCLWAGICVRRKVAVPWSQR